MTGVQQGDTNPASISAAKSPASQYTVVARRYRPQQFSDLVGQSHVTQALANAIAQNRVGHAYLFTGARGTGKTTSARIFAKCLNCRNSPGPTDRPCDAEDRHEWCDVCQRISVGEDIDVIEIDGASNRGIDEIRELRSNINVRPSRCRYKIYIIDEVHMLTTQAFNALLKTLEEPPDHVKFFFCTTDPQKIPITVLSRCQRFDFIPVESTEISQRLREIAAKEGVEVTEEAVALVARRAAGSMRDSQSLFEQLLAGCELRITADDVYKLLGIADTRRVGQIFSAMLQRQPRVALELIHQSIAAGVDPGQLAQQLVGFSRDLLAAKLGCQETVLINIPTDQLPELQALAQAVTVDQLLMTLQILDQAVVKIQHSLHARILLDAAAVRICQLESLRSVSGLLQQISEIAPQSHVVAGPGTVAVAGQQHPAVAAAGNEVTAVPQVGGPSSNAGTSLPDSLTDSKKKRADDDATEFPRNGAREVESVEQHRIGGEHQKEAVPLITPVAAVAPFETTPAPLEGIATVAAKRAELAIEAADRPRSETLSSASDVAPTRTGIAISAQHEVQSTEPNQPVESSPDKQDASGSLEDLWHRVLSKLEDLTKDIAADYKRLSWEGHDCVLVVLKNEYNFQMCNRADRKAKLEAALGELLQRRIRIDFRCEDSRGDGGIVKKPVFSRRQQMRLYEQDPFIKAVIDQFDAEVVDFTPPRIAARSAPADS